MSISQIKTAQQEIANLQADVSRKHTEVATKEQALKQMYSDAVSSASFYAGVPCSVKADTGGIPFLVVDTAHKIGIEDDTLTIAYIWTNSSVGASVRYPVILDNGTFHLTARKSGQQILIKTEREDAPGGTTIDLNDLGLAGRIIGQFILDSGFVADLSAYNTWHNNLIEEIASKTALANDGQDCLDQMLSTHK